MSPLERTSALKNHQDFGSEKIADARLTNLSNPYLTITFDNKELKTPVQRKTANPIWNAQMKFPIRTKQVDDLEVRIGINRF